MTIVGSCQRPVCDLRASVDVAKLGREHPRVHDTPGLRQALRLPQHPASPAQHHSTQDATQDPAKPHSVPPPAPAEPESLTAQELTHTMAGGSSHRSAFKRLLKELEKWRVEAEEETGIERLGPPNDEDLLTWEAVINGRGVGSGYDGS